MMLFLADAQRFGYCRRRGFLAQKFNRRTNVEPCINVQSKPFSPAFGNTLLAVRLLFYVLIFLFFKIIIDTIYTIIIAIGITTNLSEGNKYQRIKTKIVLTIE